MEYQFFERNFGKENIISAVVHMDEATPHMHLCFVPITAKGRLASTKDALRSPAVIPWVVPKMFGRVKKEETCFMIQSKSRFLWLQ